MLNDASGFQKVIIAAGYTDLRRGIDGLATIIRYKYQLDPYSKNTLFLFCGKRADRMKALMWEGDGFLLLYKVLTGFRYQWPRNAQEVKALTQPQYQRLLEGLEIERKTFNVPKHLV